MTGPLTCALGVLAILVVYLTVTSGHHKHQAATTKQRLETTQEALGKVGARSAHLAAANRALQRDLDDMRKERDTALGEVAFWRKAAQRN